MFFFLDILKSKSSGIIKEMFFQPRLGELQQLVQSMCGWEGNGFPGSQPVSMDQKNINLLHTEPYRVSWKADGTRFGPSTLL